MKKIVIIALLFISNIVYSQSIQIINDDDFTFKSNNQSFVLFKIRVIDEIGYYTSEQIENGQYAPLFRIMKFDNVFTKKWDTPISTRHNIEERIKDGIWTKKGDNTVYEWLYLLETNPKKSGYFFETLSLVIDRNKINIPILRKIATENNKLYNYGTIEITISQADRQPSYKLVNDVVEKENIIIKVEALYPNIYSAYKDKVFDDELKFFFAITTVGEINKKSTYDYWSKLYGDGIDGQTGYGITINSKKDGKSQQTQMSFNEIIDLPVNFDITYTSEWKKGHPDRPYGLIMGNSANNKYFFYNTTNGQSGIEGTSNGTNEISEIRNQNTFSSGNLNKMNNYKIEIRNNKATYYVDKIKIGAFDLNTDLSKAFFVGFMVKDKQKVYFDKLQIIEQ